MKTKDQNCACLCGSAASYASCCARFHRGEAAETAEQLMRSRYVAYAMQQLDYVSDTWHPDTRPAQLTAEPNVRWLGLKILAHKQQDPTHATVEFVARYRVGGGTAVRMRECSRFERLADGRWYYRDGDVSES